MKKGRHGQKEKRFPWRAILRTLLMGLAGLLLGLGLYTWNANTLMRNTMPMPFGWGLSVVLSGSMEPTLSVNDLALIRQTQEVEVGDVVVYQSGDSLVIHRVIAIDGDSVQTKGDANNAADEPISMGDIKGVLVCSIPAVGQAILVLKRPAVMLLVLAAVLVLTEVSWRDERREDDEEIEKLRQEIRRLKQEEGRGDFEGRGSSEEYDMK